MSYLERNDKWVIVSKNQETKTGKTVSILSYDNQHFNIG